MRGICLSDLVLCRFRHGSSFPIRKDQNSGSIAECCPSWLLTFAPLKLWPVFKDATDDCVKLIHLTSLRVWLKNSSSLPIETIDKPKMPMKQIVFLVSDFFLQNSTLKSPIKIVRLHPVQRAKTIITTKLYNGCLIACSVELNLGLISCIN